MKTTRQQDWRALLCALGLLATCGVHAQDNAAPPPSAAPKFSSADLEKLVAPIALHPDPLIAILLPASVYPLEIVQAARFIKDTNNLAKVDQQSWDENVKAVAKFPDLLAKMDADLSWTSDLGQAFVEQQKEVMDTIQALRAKANAAGVLKTTPQQVIVVTNSVVQTTVQQQVVYVTNTVVQIQPSNPQVVYVPTYPSTIYYPPAVYVGPPPVVTFAAGIAVGAIIANNCDWHGGGIYVGHHGVAVWGGGGYHGDVDIDVNRNTTINTGNINSGNRPTQTTQQKWQPDQSRMSSSGAAGAKASTQAAQTRGWSSGTAQATPANRGPTAAARPSPSTPAAGPRPSASPSPSRPSPSPSPSSARPSPSPSSAARPSSGQSAFGGVNSGSSSHNYSNRGSASRGGGGGGGGAGRASGGRGR